MAVISQSGSALEFHLFGEVGNLVGHANFLSNIIKNKLSSRPSNGRNYPLRGPDSHERQLGGYYGSYQRKNKPEWRKNADSGISCMQPAAHAGPRSVECRNRIARKFGWEPEDGVLDQPDQYADEGVNYAHLWVFRFLQIRRLFRRISNNRHLFLPPKLGKNRQNLPIQSKKYLCRFEQSTKGKKEK